MGISPCGGRCGVPTWMPSPHMPLKTETLTPHLLEVLEAMASYLSLSVRLALS